MLFDFFLITIIAAGLSEILRRALSLGVKYIAPFCVCSALCLNAAYFPEPSVYTGLIIGGASAAVCYAIILLPLRRFA